MVTRYFILLGAALGLFIGIGGYTFIYARGASYLTDNPQACANCHVMNEQYTGWINGSHRSVAVCNDCHTPTGAVAKYTTKAANGFHHSVAMTTGRFPDQILITSRNRQITEAACRKCHADVVQAIEALEGARQFQRRGQFFLDYVEAENSMGFHADQEAMRILALSLDNTRQGQIVLRNATGMTAGPNSAPPFEVGRPVKPGERGR